VVHRPGGHRRLRIEEHPSPTVRADDVLIRVAAAGVNYADCMVRMGLYRSARETVGWPITPGFEVAGTIAAVGSRVEDVRIGDEVLAVVRFGGYAEEVTAPRRQVFRVPRGIPSIEAAGLPTVFLTAYYALCELAHPRPGQTLLVHSGAGGVGGALVQLGKLLGCEVVAAVGSAHKVAAVRNLGADHVVDGASEGLWKTAEAVAPEGFDVILDANGGASLRRSYRHLREPGKLVTYGFHTMLRRGRQRPDWLHLLMSWLRTPRFNPLEMTARNRSVLAFNLSTLFAEVELLGDAMERLLGWLEAGRLRPLPTTPCRFEDVAEAHRALESGRTVGKLVLIP
jgi:NADPH:quinone reductase-like Zn-dependent oxidoreductase